MYFLRGDQIMVWVVCSGLIPPYNSGGGGVVGGEGCSNAPCQNEQYFVAESVFASHYIW